MSAGGLAGGPDDRMGVEWKVVDSGAVRCWANPGGKVKRLLGEFTCEAELADGVRVTPAGKASSWRKFSDPDIGTFIEHTSAPGLFLRHHVLSPAGSPGIQLQVELVNRSPNAVVVRRLVPASCQGGMLLDGGNDLKWLQLAYCSANTHSPVSRSRVIELEQNGVRLDSWWMTAAWSERRRMLLTIGFTTFFRFVARLRMESGGLFRAINYCEDRTVQPGDTVRSEILSISADREPFAGLHDYAGEVATAMRITGLPEPLCGWSSWGHYLEAIDADTIAGNLSAIASSAGRFSDLQLISIDEGWEQKLGGRRPDTTWLPASRFGADIADLVAEIRKRGRQAGIWLAPLVVNEGSVICVEHPEWLVKNASGQPKHHALGKGIYVLDPTHPEAQQFLRGVIRRVTHDWGFSYLKLDFLRCVVSVEPDNREYGLDTLRQFFSGGTGVEAYRSFWETIWEAAAPGTRILACGDPLGPGLGLIGARRIGHDISPEWGDDMTGIMSSSRNVAANYFWSGRVLRNDPDFVLLSGEANEARLWATMVALAGGDTMISADMASLVPWQRKVIEGIIPPYGTPARPLDLFENDPPTLWHLPVKGLAGNWHIVGLFNWYAQPREIAVSWVKLGLQATRRHDVFEFWTQTDRGSHARGYAATVPGRSVALLAIRESSDVPALLGSGMHFTQGIAEWQRLAWNSNDCAIEAEAAMDLLREIPFTFRVPAGFEPLKKPGASFGAERQWNPRRRTLRVALRLSRGQTVRIPFVCRHRSGMETCKDK